MDEKNLNSAPETTILRKAGLTESQAKGYLALIEHGQLTPVELAEKTGESRTNGYQICEKLEKLGLATKKDGKKAIYSPAHPSALETLAERRRKAVQRNEQEVKNNIGTLIDFYYESRDTPGVTTEVGRNAIESVYNNILRDGQTLEYLRSPYDSGYMSSEYYKEYYARRAKAGVYTKVIAIDTERSRKRWSPEYDTHRLIKERFWLQHSDYDAKVEWSVYGDKVSALTFGEQPIAVTIHSKEIAESFRQLFNIVRKQGEKAG